MEGGELPPLYEQLFDLTIQICGQFPSFTPISIREEDAEEVVTMFARFITLARRKNRDSTGGINALPGKGTKQAIGRSGQRYIIHSYEDNSGLKFGG